MKRKETRKTGALLKEGKKKTKLTFCSLKGNDALAAGREGALSGKIQKRPVQRIGEKKKGVCPWLKKRLRRGEKV